MGECVVDDNCHEVTNIVLVGPTGHGKSSTGNSIIGKKVFDTMPSLARVTTTTSELHSTVLEDGKIVNVIDTPGLMDFSAESELIGKEIAKCINMAKDGIHSVLLVLSLGKRFSQDDAAAVENLRQFFSDKNNNGGKPYSNELFVQLKKGESKMSDQTAEANSSEVSEIEEKFNKSYEEQLKQNTQTVESRLRQSILRLEKQLAEERAARLEAEAKAQAAQMIPNDLILKLMECMERAHRKKADELLKTSREVEEKLGEAHRKTEKEEEEEP